MRGTSPIPGNADRARCDGRMGARAAGIILVAWALLWGQAAFAWSFGVCGDSRDDGKGVFPRILSAVERSDMEFLIHTGDLERPGGIRSWRRFREKAARFPKPLHVVVGNHELRGGTREEFVRFFALPGSSYSFRHRDAHFALADNAGGRLSPELLRWLDQDLARHPKGKNGIVFLVVAMHYPPRTDGIFPHGTDRGYEEQSAALLEILQRHRVDLLLASHEHLQQVEEWGGTKVVVSGGAGAPMYPFQRHGFYRIHLEDGAVRETFVRIRVGGNDP